MHPIAYFDCSSGISGDMTLGALLDAGARLEPIIDAVRSMGLEDCKIYTKEEKRAGIRATKLYVEAPEETTHRHLRHILELIHKAKAAPEAKALAERIFRRLAEAEAKVHGTTIEKVHFHEVGAVDAIVDIVGTAIAWVELGAPRAICSAIPVGSGTVKAAHGIMPVPAPAVAELLRGVPIAESKLSFELTTPSGAAIITCLAEQFGPMPSMTLDKIGYGAGSRNFENQPNVLRVFLGQAFRPVPSEQIWVVETNLDDVPGELVGYCVEKLFRAGALDVYVSPIQMKKNRPAVKLSVIADEKVLTNVEEILLVETGTLGVRRWQVARRTLPRTNTTVQTPWGKVEGKVCWLSDQTVRFTPEYESCRKIAAEFNVPLREVYQAAQAAFNPEEFLKQFRQQERGDQPRDINRA